MVQAILLTEDNSFDAKVFQRAVQNAGIHIPVMVARDGIEALALLRGRRDAAAMLVVTDLKMPRMGGIELLRTIRRTADIAHLPVFVATTSDLASDHREALALGIEGYIRKSGDEQSLVDPILAYLAKQGISSR